ncbi:MAG: hypothetical protein WAK96_15475 [Desulfobaccales bacterium]
MPDTQPSQTDVVASLAAAKDAARQAYSIALAINPDDENLSKLYDAWMAAETIWSTAELHALNADAVVAKAQADLDAATKEINNNLATLKDIAQWVKLLDGLVNLATAVGKFFV